MNKLIFIAINLSLLFYQLYAIDCYNSCSTGCASTTSTFGCSCNNGNDAAVLFSTSINGVSLNRIGQDDYFNFITKAADIVAQSTGLFGLYTFGNTGTSIISLSTTDYSSIDSSIANIPSQFVISSQYGNGVGGSVTNAISTFSSITGRQKYHVIFSAGFPLFNFGTSTRLNNYDNPCGNTASSKQQNIQTFVVLYGEEGKDFVKGSYSCLVEDPDNDIIIVDPTDPDTSLAAISDLLCRSDGFDVKITEVNPVGQTGGYQAFIEGINRGMEASIRACFSGGCSNYITVPTGEYFVAYDSTSNGNTPTASHSITGLGSSNGNTGWVATLEINGYSSPIDTVTYDSSGSNGVSDWQIVNTLKTYELRGVGYNNEYGANWRQSCDTGSPGTGPVSECSTTPNSCLQSNIDCTINGATTTTKCGSTTKDYCNCDHDGIFMSDYDSCIKMPLPTNCRGYIVNDPLYITEEFLVLEWDRAEWDGDIEYSAIYLTTGGTSTASALEMSSVVIKNYAPYTTTSAQDYANIKVNFIAPVSGSQYSATADITCPVVTQTPTSSPTISPTRSPINYPTVSPTPPPTHDEPGVYIDSYLICGISRCECFGEPRDCCIPPSQGSCEEHIRYIEVPKENKEDYQQEIAFNLYPDHYTAETIVYYQLTAYGQFNRTDFANSSLLSSISPRDNITNTLKISVDPIGLNDVYYGNVTIVDGDEFGTLTLNINAYDLICNEGDTDCIAFYQCFEQRLLFKLTTIRCDISGKQCINMYPSSVWISVGRSSELCKSLLPGTVGSNELPDYIWWVLIALVVFAIILGWLIYRFWTKQKRTVKEIGDVEDDLIREVNEIEQGVAKDLDRGDIMFNQMATGIPNYVQPMDPAGNELHDREQREQNEFAHVDAEVFQVRTDFGPQPTDNSIHARTIQQRPPVSQQRPAMMNTGFNYNQYPYPTPTKYNNNRSRSSKSHSHSNSQ